MIGKQRFKHRSCHARKLLDYAIKDGDWADIYFPMNAYLHAGHLFDAWQARHRTITERKGVLKYGFDDNARKKATP